MSPSPSLSPSRFSRPGVWEAYLGLHIQKQFGNKVEKRNLKQIISHPYYNSYTFDYDIALMELDSPVSYSDYIRPICLPAPQHFFAAGNSVWITGWGATREGGESHCTTQDCWYWRPVVLNPGPRDPLPCMF